MINFINLLENDHFRMFLEISIFDLFIGLI